MPTEIVIENSILAVGATYQNVFGRAPNSQESAGWAEQIGDNGVTTAQLATVLADSPEGAARVSALYEQVLGRSGTGVSSSEIASGQAYLAKDAPNGLASLRASMASSAEAQADIKADYQTVLGRAASSAEISTAENALANGATLADLYSSATVSPELTADLTSVYEGAFGTAPSAAVVTFLRQQISGGAAYLQLTTALNNEGNAINGSGGVIISTGGASAPVTAQIISATQDAAGVGYVDISGTGQPGASISASVTGTISGASRTITSPSVALVDASGTWSVTNAPGSGGLGAGMKVPDGTYSVTPIETVNGQALDGTATSITVSSAGVSIPDAFNPAESMAAGASVSAAASATAMTSTVASAVSLVHLTNLVTAGIAPMLHT